MKNIINLLNNIGIDTKKNTEEVMSLLADKWHDLDEGCKNKLLDEFN